MFQNERYLVQIAPSYNVAVVPEEKGYQDMKSHYHQIVASITAILQNIPYAKLKTVGQQKCPCDCDQIKENKIQMFDPAS